MSSKRNQRRKACEGKVRHATIGGAYKAARAMQQGGGEQVEVYPCRFCRGYHTGHPRQTAERRRAMRDRNEYKYVRAGWR